jgi:hypothetical protein
VESEHSMLLSIIDMMFKVGSQMAYPGSLHATFWLFYTYLGGCAFAVNVVEEDHTKYGHYFSKFGRELCFNCVLHACSKSSV